ncbi:MAG: DUF167 domain-containing protein [Vampirovibrionales bacterium]|nr:DUF167 domain-containing protein [Vampirovibrionales bacterium]
MAYLPVRATPGSRREGLGPYRPDAPWLAVRVSAPPQDGKANEAIFALLAKALDLPVSHLRVTRGQSSRLKTIAIACDDPENALKRLAQALDCSPQIAFTVDRLSTDE